jgi:hypothetical protein
VVKAVALWAASAEEVKAWVYVEEVKAAVAATTTDSSLRVVCLPEALPQQQAFVW